MLQLLYPLGKRVAGADSMRVGGPESTSGSFAGKNLLPLPQTEPQPVVWPLSITGCQKQIFFPSIKNQRVTNEIKTLQQGRIWKCNPDM